MQPRSRVWIERVGRSDLLKESRRHLDLLRCQLRADSATIEAARVCIAESLDRLAELDKPCFTNEPD